MNLNKYIYAEWIEHRWRRRQTPSWSGTWWGSCGRCTESSD